MSLSNDIIRWLDSDRSGKRLEALSAFMASFDRFSPGVTMFKIGDRFLRIYCRANVCPVIDFV